MVAASDACDQSFHSTDTHAVEPKQARQLVDLAGDVACADGAMMGGAMGIPLFHEASRTEWKSIATVGVANLENCSGNALSFGDQQHEPVLLIFDDGE